VLVGMARVNDEDELLFVQLQSPGECGSGGCSTASSAKPRVGGRLETDRKPDLTPAIFLLFGTTRRLEALGIAADVAAAMVNVQPGVNA